MRHRKRWLTVFLLVATVFWSVSAPAEEGPPAEYVLHVKAVIDGSSDLVLQGDKVHWEHKAFDLPGTSLHTRGDGPWPITINGVEWLPKWQGNVSDAFALPFTLPADLTTATLALNKLRARGWVRAEVRQGQIVVQFSDGEGGADWYEIELRIAQAGATGPGTAASKPTPAPLPKPPPAAAQPALPASTTSGTYIAVQADAEAKALAGQRLGQQAVTVNAAWQRVLQAQAVVDQLVQGGADLQAKLRECQAKLDYEQKQYDYYWSLGVNGGDIRWFTPGQLYYVNYYERRVNDLKAQRDRIRGAQTRNQADLKQADEGLRKVSQEHDTLRRHYEADFTRIYNEEYPKRKLAWEQRREKATADSDARLKGQLNEAVVSGEYAWIERATEVDRLVFSPDHTAKSKTGDGKPTWQWKMTETGLQLTQEKAEWLFVPAGPPNTWLGTCLGPGITDRGRKALLRKETAVKAAGASQAVP